MARAAERNQPIGTSSNSLPSAQQQRQPYPFERMVDSDDHDEQTPDPSGPLAHTRRKPPTRHAKDDSHDCTGCLVEQNDCS